MPTITSRRGPTRWYLRNYKNKQFIGGGDAPAGPDMPVMFLEYAKHNNDPKLSDYIVQRYAIPGGSPRNGTRTSSSPGLTQVPRPS